MTSNYNIVHGVGINNAGYVVDVREHLEERRPSGLRKTKSIWKCPFYVKWSAMLGRCYSKSHLKRRPTYKGCSVCKEWLTFSNFRLWMEKQDWEGKHLDKDILVKDNKVYSPETCVFVVGVVNTFLEDCKGGRGDLLLGVCLGKVEGSYYARCRNPLDSDSKRHVGTYYSEVAAHLAWKSRKNQYARVLANSVHVTDLRVRGALLSRFANCTEVEGHL